MTVDPRDVAGPPAPDPTAPGWPASDMLDAAWGLIANASGGDWAKESPDWQAAAARWRDAYVAGAAVPAPPAGLSVCGHAFDAMVCVAPAGHEGPHITSNERFPHGLPRLVPGAPAAALIAAAWRVVSRWEVRSADDQHGGYMSVCDECDGTGEDERPETITHTPSCAIGALRAALAAQGEPDSSPGGVRPP